MTRFLYGVSCEDDVIQSFFDLVGILAAPQKQKRTRTHITLQGPYDEEKAMVEELPSNDADICGLDLFDTPRGTALVLLISLPDVGKVWDKPSYPDGKPHLTMFEGNSDFAMRMRDAIKDTDVLNVSFKVTEIGQINVKNLPAQEFENYPTIKRLYSSIFRKDWKGIAHIQRLNDAARIKLIKGAFQFLAVSQKNTNRVAPSQFTKTFESSSDSNEDLPLFSNA